MATITIITTAAAAVVNVELGAPAAEDEVVVMVAGEYAAKYGPSTIVDGFQKKP